MNLTGALLEIGQRTASEKDRPATGQAALSVLIGLGAMPFREGSVVRALLVAIGQPEDNPTFSHADIELLSPLALAAFQRLTDALLDGELSDSAIRSISRP